MSHDVMSNIRQALAVGFWSAGPLPMPMTMEGALEAAASPDKVVLVGPVLVSTWFVGVRVYSMYQTREDALSRRAEQEANLPHCAQK